jgi:hypothetical protein
MHAAKIRLAFSLFAFPGSQGILPGEPQLTISDEPNLVNSMPVVRKSYILSTPDHQAVVVGYRRTSS